ncbi:MAG: alpha/beta hydrolase [Agromyces sp.]
MAINWTPDILGPRFQQATLPLGRDSEGEVVATIVRHTPLPRFSNWLRRAPLADVDVLYVHGWNDYFFQRELAEFWTNRGARFFALDLRKYGRSLRPGQTPGYIESLETYDADIEAALEAMQSNGRRIFLLGHSTGGLVFTLWADRHPGRIDALLLNSPWLETQGSTIARMLMTPVLKAQARVNATAKLPSVDLGFYSRSIDVNRDGEWEFNPAWRLERGFPAKSAWGAAIIAGHNRVAAGLNIDVPILTLLSKRSLIAPVWSPEMLRTDIVLIVDDIAKRALGLGEAVTVVRLDGALHDVFLSQKTVREEAYRQIDRWLVGYAR